MARHNELGKWGEEQVVEKLILDGYTIAERNWRMNHLEIDIVATRGEDIVFVEVKTREDGHSNPLDAITPKKSACSAAPLRPTCASTESRSPPASTWQL